MCAHCYPGASWKCATCSKQGLVFPSGTSLYDEYRVMGEQGWYECSYWAWTGTFNVCSEECAKRASEVLHPGYGLRPPEYRPMRMTEEHP